MDTNQLPDFRLLDVLSEQYITPDDVASGKGVVLMFLSNTCAHDQHIVEHLIGLTDDYIARQVAFLAVNPCLPSQNAEESFEAMKDRAEVMEYPFPYLYDPQQTLARTLAVNTTATFFVFDAEGSCCYRGPYDYEQEVKGTLLGQALDALLEQAAFPESRPANGCSLTLA